jgi:hypothetical protein
VFLGSTLLPVSEHFLPITEQINSVFEILSVLLNNINQLYFLLFYFKKLVMRTPKIQNTAGKKTTLRLEGPERHLKKK